MKIGVNYRNWGPHATRENLLECARIADASAIDSIWVNDHVGFPPGQWDNPMGVPEDMGNIVDAFAVMAMLGAATSRITFGSGVVVAPYRPALLTAKWLQSIQLLSGGRALFGVGVGYFPEEFAALGVDIRRRGRITDETLTFLHTAFSGEPVEQNGQQLVLEPQTQRPPFYVGGTPNVAIPRAVALGDGWMPVGVLPHDLGPLVQELQQRAADADRPPLEVVMMKTLPIDNLGEALDMVHAYAEAGVTHLVHTQAYDSPEQYGDFVSLVSEAIVLVAHEA